MNDPSRSELDPRALRTRTALMDAVQTLMIHTELRDLTITQVVHQAGVNRSSFYQHYRDLHSLFADTLDRMADSVNRPAPMRLGDADHASIPATVAAYARHLATHHRAYSWAFGPEGSPQIAARLRGRFAQMLRIGLRFHAPGLDEAELDRDAVFLAGGMVTSLAHWLDSADGVDADAFAEWLWGAVSTAFLALTGQPARGTATPGAH